MSKRSVSPNSPVPINAPPEGEQFSMPNLEKYPSAARRLIARFLQLAAEEATQTARVREMIGIAKELREKYNLNYTEYARDFAKRSKSRISEWKNLVDTIPAYLWDDSKSIRWHERAAAASKQHRVPIEKTIEVLHKMGSRADRKSSVREINTEMERAKAEIAVAKKPPAEPQYLPDVVPQSCDDLDNKYHHADFRDFIRRIPRRSVHLIHLDGPYMYADGRACDHIETNRTRGRTACAEAAEALQFHLDFFTSLAEFDPLAPDGYLCMWANGEEIDMALRAAMDVAGYAVRRRVMWLKNNGGLAGMQQPVREWCEVMYVLQRKDDSFIHPNPSYMHENKATTCNVWREPRMRQRKMDTHIFQKPSRLMRREVETLCPPGGKVWDVCSCSASMPIACLRTGRTFLACEKHPENYAWGARRLARAVERLTKAIPIAGPAGTDATVSGGNAGDSAAA